MRTGWFKAVHIKSWNSQAVRALLAARSQLVGIRVRLENEVRGLLETVGVRLGKGVGGFARRAEEAVCREIDLPEEVQLAIESLLGAGQTIKARLAILDGRLRRLARDSATCRLLMTVPGVGPIVALSVRSVLDDVSRFQRSSSAGAYLGLTPRRYASGEIDRMGRITKRGDRMTRTHLYEAANVLLTREIGFSRLKAWGLRIAKRAGFKKAKVAVARKLAVILHAMWKSRRASVGASPRQRKGDP